MYATKPHTLQNWIPLHLKQATGGLLVEWMDAGKKTFTEPFFDDTLAALRRETPRQPFKSVSTPAMMTEWSARMDSVPPAALIFHVSRCGSTLLSQLLGTQPQNIVLSEVPVLDEILRLPYKQNERTEAETIACFKAALCFYGQRRTGKELRMFVKTDSWHLHFYPLLRLAFPHIPFVMLYRNPAEVVQSQQKKPGLHAIPGLIEPSVFGFKEGSEIGLDMYLAQVLSSYFKTMLAVAQKDPLTLLWNYRDGITGLALQLYHRMGLEPSGALQNQFEARSSFDAKQPLQAYNTAYDGTTFPEYLRPVMNLYERLDRYAKA